jgi:hypothetical protein
MKKEEIKDIVAKYRKLATKSHIQLDNEKGDNYDLIAVHIEDNIERFAEDDSYETEEDLLNDFNETESEYYAQLDAMFPNGDDDDSITDYLTR